MPDRNDSSSVDPSVGPSDADLRATLRTLLASFQEEGRPEWQKSADVDAGDVARRLEVLRGDVPQGTADDVTLLGDVGYALARVESGSAEGPSQAVLAAAREAFARSGRPEVAAVPVQRAHAGAPITPEVAGLRVLHARRPAPVAAFLRALAAVLVVGVGVAWFVRPRSAEAQPVLEFAGVDHYAVGGAGTGAAQVAIGGRLEARPGTAFVAGGDEVLALRLAEGGRLVLRSGERLTVVPAHALSGQRGVEGGALLRLQGGEVLLACATAPTSAPVVLLLSVPQGAQSDGRPLGVLVLLSGAAHVEQAPGRESQPAVALSQGAVAQFVPAAAGAKPVDLRGPAQVLLGGEGAVVEGAPAQAVFRDLEVFGGPLRERRVEPLVPASLWRVVSGRAQRAGDGVTLRLPAPRATAAVPTEPETVLAWKPDPSALQAGVLRLLLRGPEGLTVSLPDLGASAVLTAADVRAEPGLVTLDLALPEGWASRLPPHGELRLAFAAAPVLTAPNAGSPTAALPVFAPVRFDGAFLGRAAARPGE